ncbi:MAG: hypothetical protein SOI04_04605 [Bifidobacterium thermacidophilum]|uniref:hypothetical protein n=1 Tax=Bifidobacterium thermacidophilum TaxID=246618 RepID=UPI002F34FB6E
MTSCSLSIARNTAMNNSQQDIPVIDIPAQTHPWSTVLALAEATDDPTDWRLTGGLMVQLHAMARGTEARPTTDADLLVDVLTHQHAVRRVEDLLKSLGFTTHVGTLSDYTTRMTRGTAVVDLLVDNHLSPFLKNRACLDGHPMLGMPGSRKAVARSMLVTLRYEDTQATMCIPDVLGALLMKIASWRETHQGDRSRHLYDAALLASMIDDPRKELLRLDCHSPSDRRNIKTLTEQLAGDDADDYFDPLSPEQVAQAKMAINEFSRLLAMPRHGGPTEEYLR